MVQLVKNPLANAGDMDETPGLGTKKPMCHDH